jgi:hypothetical protein
MKTKYTVLIVGSLFLFKGIAQAQDTVKTKKNIIAVDLTPLIKTIFDFGDSYYGGSNNPYLFLYRRVAKDKNVLRVGLGFSIAGGNDTHDDTIKTNSHRHAITTGIGYERWVSISKRWTFYVGSDAIFTYEDNYSKYAWTQTVYRETYLTRYKYGISPLIGVTFKINKRMSVSTETSFNFVYTEYNYKEINYPIGGDNSQYDRKDKGSNYDFLYIPPTSIQFRFSF